MDDSDVDVESNDSQANLRDVDDRDDGLIINIFKYFISKYF